MVLKKCAASTKSFLQGLSKGLRAHAVRAAFPRDLSLEAWGRRFAPAYLANKAGVPVPCGAHHVQIDALLRSLHKRDKDGKGRKLDIQAPRGNSKSTFCTFLYPLHCICEGTEKYVILIADTYKQAKKYLTALKAELETNEALAQVYPEACGVGPTWAEDEILTRNGVRVEVLGSGQKIRGRKEGNLRPTLIIIDDPEGDECAYSETIRTHTRDWFEKAVSKAGSPTTNFLLVGTNVHEECLVSYMMHQPGWESYVFQSIVTWPRRMDLWDEWEGILRDTSPHPAQLKPENRAKFFFECNKKAMLEGFVVLWREHEDEYALMLERSSSHNAFDAEKQNEPVDASKCEWPGKIFFPPSVWVDAMPAVEDCQCRASYCDPSKGLGDKNGDFQAICDGAVGKDGCIYVDSDIGYRTLPDLCTEFVRRANRNKSWVAKVESNTFQELLLPDLDAAAKEQGVLCPIQGQENMTNKDLRIRRYIGPYITRGKIKLVRRSRGNAELVRQTSLFPTGGKRDGPDALAGLIQCFEEILNESEGDRPENPQ